MKNKVFRPLRQSGFTLIEIMVVVVILGILATLVVPTVIQNVGEARINKARSDIRTIESQLEMFRLHAFRYPTTDEGIESLVKAPASPDARDRWKGPYLPKIPTDPWGRPYLYLSPGTRASIDVYSLGADGQPGGDGENGDIGNWNLD
ncbi:MAG: type II secretion system major pseudopilin GspG [Gammaproteobacteria bacterium]|nr:type II secretion system major pseudopilin GspG [Gammaproteobacteria bacterium]NNF61835.1 type II secretion system major pseudopilin GspG [Gammaproteobacteria bacterium]